MLFDRGARSTLLPLQALSEAPAAIMNQAAADSDIMLPQRDFELEDEVSFVNSRRGNPGPVARRDVSETPDWATHPVIFARIEFNNLPHLPEAARKFQALQIYSFVSSSLCGVLFTGFGFKFTFQSLACG